MWPGLTQEQVQWPRARCSPTKSSVQRDTWRQHQRFSTWQAVGWEVRNCCACAARTQIGVAFSTLIQAARLPRPSNPQVRSSHFPLQRSGHTCWAPEFTYMGHALPPRVGNKGKYRPEFQNKMLPTLSIEYQSNHILRHFVFEKADARENNCLQNRMEIKMLCIREAPVTDSQCEIVHGFSRCV